MWPRNGPPRRPQCASTSKSKSRPPLCDIPSGCCSFTGPWTVTRSSLRMLRQVAAFCRPLRPVLLLVSFPRSRSPVVPPPPMRKLQQCLAFQMQYIRRHLPSHNYTEQAGRACAVCALEASGAAQTQDIPADTVALVGGEEHVHALLSAIPHAEASPIVRVHLRVGVLITHTLCTPECIAEPGSCTCGGGRGGGGSIRFQSTSVLAFHHPNIPESVAQLHVGFVTKRRLLLLQGGGGGLRGGKFSPCDISQRAYFACSPEFAVGNFAPTCCEPTFGWLLLLADALQLSPRGLLLLPDELLVAGCRDFKQRYNMTWRSCDANRAPSTFVHIVADNAWQRQT